MNGSASVRFTRQDHVRIALLLALGAICLLIGIRLFPKAFPEASIKFDVDRKQSQARAETALRASGFDVAGYRHVSAFTFDDTAKVFLERELGLEEMNHAVENTAKIWRWSHRWFRPQTKEEYRVEIAPTGETVAISHVLAEDAPGARLAEPEARAVAEAFLSEIHPQGTAGLRFLGSTSRDLKERRDHVFTWEESGIDWKGGRYRRAVVVQGDRPGGYSESVHVPESWIREYELLRSKNTTTGMVDSVFMILTLIAAVIVIFVRMRDRVVRWRFAATLGLIGAGLSFLKTMNALPISLFGYPTTDSYGGFLSAALFRGLWEAALTGLWVLVVVAAGELLYREAFPRKLSVPGLFTRTGFRTKEFFYSTLGGLVLVPFFVAYQTIFYIAASKLGAWSPAEVPYDELLNSAVPWVFLLYIGFIPSVTEEFMSRAFSVPFFMKAFKNRAAAIVLAAFIWGFGHALYPNQPFYIRGIEVGVAGIIFGVLMLRYNLLVCLVWHFTVDAFLSGIVLLRSGSPYYMASAIVAGGMFILPFVISLVAYLRKGSFVDSEALRGGIVSPPPSSAIPRDVAKPAGERSEGRPAGIPPSPIPAAVPGPGNRRLLVALAASVAVLVIAAVTIRPELPKTPVTIDRAAAFNRAETFLKDHGVATGGFRHSIRFGAAADPDAVRYVQANQGLDGLRAFWPERLPAHVWRVRFFKPLEVQETMVSVDAGSGRITGFEHSIAEKDSLPTVAAGAAEALAAGLLASAGYPPGVMERKEAEDKPRDKRMDRHFAWEAPEGDPRNVADARYRLDADVTGDRPAGFRIRLKLPEAYERLREQHTAGWGISLALLILGAAGIFALALQDSIRAHMAGRIPWKRLLRVGVFAGLLSIIGMINAWPRFLSTYVTTMPWASYVVFFMVAIVTSFIVYFLAGWAGTATAKGMVPSISSLTDPAAVRRMIPAAAVALVVVPVWGRILGLVRLALAGAFPAAAPPPDLYAGGRMDMLLPGVAIPIGALIAAFGAGWAIAALTTTLRSREWPGRIGRLGLFAGLAVGLALTPARTTGEGLIGLLRVGLGIGVAWGLLRLLAPGNPLAVLAGGYGLFASRGIAELLSQPSPWARSQGVVAAVLAVVPVVVVWMFSRRGRAA
jgi:membrane protease YdiL (CAAX protease family)